MFLFVIIDDGVYFELFIYFLRNGCVFCLCFFCYVFECDLLIVN